MLLQLRMRLEENQTCCVNKDLEGDGCALFQNPVSANLLGESCSNI